MFVQFVQRNNAPAAANDCPSQSFHEIVLCCACLDFDFYYRVRPINEWKLRDMDIHDIIVHKEAL